jgi:hypothetical protein
VSRAVEAVCFAATLDCSIAAPVVLLQQWDLDMLLLLHCCITGVS